MTDKQFALIVAELRQRLDEAKADIVVQTVDLHLKFGVEADCYPGFLAHAKASDPGFDFTKESVNPRTQQVVAFLCRYQPPQE